MKAKKVSSATMKRRAAANAVTETIQTVEKPEKEKSKKRTLIFQRKINANFFNTEDAEVEIKVPAKAYFPPNKTIRNTEEAPENVKLKSSDDGDYGSQKSSRKTKAQRTQEKI